PFPCPRGMTMPSCRDSMHRGTPQSKSSLTAMCSPWLGRSVVGLIAALTALVSGAEQAQRSETTLPTVIVTTHRGAISSFDVPGSVSRVDGGEVGDARLQAQLSEGLAA